MKKRNYIFIIITILLLISSIYFNINTINKAEQRIITEKENTPITELLTKPEEQSVEEIAEEEKDTMVVKETNSYIASELAIVITMPLLTSLSIILLFSTSFGKLSIKETINNWNLLIINGFLCFIYLLIVLWSITSEGAQKKV